MFSNTQMNEVNEALNSVYRRVFVFRKYDSVRAVMRSTMSLF